MKENKAIQSIKGIATIFIYISHFIGGRFDYFGAFGVEIFFIISGYLYSKKTINLKNIILKLIKLYPLHIFMLLLYLVLLEKKDTINVFFINLLLLQSWSPNIEIYFSYNPVSWYLSTYLFFIIVCNKINSFLKQINKNKHYIILIFLILFEFLIAKISENCNYGHWFVYIFPLTRLIDFVGGLILGNLYFNTKINLNINIFITLVLLCCSLFIKTNYFLCATWFPLCLCIITKMEKIDIKNQILYKIGNVSFEFFMIHKFIIRVLNDHCLINHDNKIILCISAIMIFELIYYLAKLFRYLNKKVSKMLSSFILNAN